MNKTNYQKLLDETIKQLKDENRVPKLLLHSCCAPCSSYVIEYLSDFFHITVFYYNPNIDDCDEYFKRAKEQQVLISKMLVKYPVYYLEGEYEVAQYLKAAAPLADEQEGGARCFLCYEMRLEQTAKTAKTLNFDYFTTTLSISPMKNAAKLNEIGKQMEDKYGILYLYSDFKKNNGYKRSTELSAEYDLYRQNYCGCSYSRRCLKN